MIRKREAMLFLSLGKYITKFNISNKLESMADELNATQVYKKAVGSGHMPLLLIIKKVGIMVHNFWSLTNLKKKKIIHLNNYDSINNLKMC